jgi:hypothetical protein
MGVRQVKSAQTLVRFMARAHFRLPFASSHKWGGLRFALRGYIIKAIGSDSLI